MISIHGVKYTATDLLAIDRDRERLRTINAELLDALNACIGALRPIQESDTRAHNPATKALKKARAAIAKAKG